ncbi:MAG TPA: lipid II flippase MurJ, partial [Ktedonobacterales bacterium]|nr:lipid II flippase MurJ [Ktedonobacterales bacterium]
MQSAANDNDILFIRMPRGAQHPWRAAQMSTGASHPHPQHAGSAHDALGMLPTPEVDRTFGEVIPTEAQTPADLTETPAPTSRRRIVSSALVIMIGQLLSSVLGMIRIETLNILFWGTASGAFVFALRPMQQLSDLLVGSSVSGALIPTFVDHSDAARREELRRIASTVANLVLILMTLAVGALFFLSPTLASIYAPNDPAGARLTAMLIRIAALALFGLGLYAVASALLYALKVVVFPAFATAVQHIGVILGGIAALLIVATQLRLPWSDVLARNANPLITRLHLEGAYGLAVGLALGALAQFLILLPPLLRLRFVWRPVLDLRHPAVRQIMRLYAPIAAGLLISLGQQNAELFLIGRMPGGALQNVTALQSATTLVQFPVGLVTAALSFAVLPPLTAAATRGDTPDFKRTLTLGMRLGLLLMVPAMVGLIALDTPIVALLFQHGTCQAGCTARNALALQNYAYQLPFLALQQLLIAAFYARKDTVTPV